jgi:hypothetical protein
MESLKSLCTLSANESIFGLTQVGQLGDIRRDASGQIGVANTQVRCSINRLNQSEMRISAFLLQDRMNSLIWTKLTTYGKIGPTKLLNERDIDAIAKLVESFYIPVCLSRGIFKLTQIGHVGNNWW